MAYLSIHCVKGKELKKGTEVYVMEYSEMDFRGVNHYLIRKYHIGNIQPPMVLCGLELYTFIINPRDGLWATDAVRRTWREKPYLHPQYTLFEAILTILEL